MSKPVIYVIRAALLLAVLGAWAWLSFRPDDATQTSAGSTASTPREVFYGFLSVGLFFALMWL